MRARELVMLWSGAFIVAAMLGIVSAVYLAPAADAAGPSPELQAGQTYEVIWTCNQAGCATEVVTIAYIDKKRGYVIDTNGWWFKPDNAMAFRAARVIPTRTPTIDHLPQIRAER